jgi:DNA-binding transcriptional ArsR family regulator
MSVKWITWAWEQPCGGAGEKLTLIALADHAGEDGTAFPGAARLADKTGQGNSTIRRHLDALEEHGLLSRERRRRADGTLSTYTYTLIQRSDRAEPALNLGGSPALTGERAEPSVPNRQKEPTPLPPKGGGPTDTTFAEFWAMYPRKESKPRALRAFKAAVKRTGDLEVIMAGLRRWTAHWTAARTATHFIPGPAVWLNGDKWDDQCPTVTLMQPRDRARAALEAMVQHPSNGGQHELG